MSVIAKNVCKSYVTGSETIDVLRNVNVEIKSKRKTAIIGPSGSGKSTLLSLLAGLDKPTSGDLMILNQNISELDERQRAVFRGKHIGIVFQNFHLMQHLTALENVELALEMNGRDRSRAADFLSDVGLGHRLKHFPKQMSGGECQRVAIARAMSVEPEILLADEPSGSLDTDTGEYVMNLLFDLAKRLDQTLILVTHNLELAKSCDETLLLEKGHLVSHGR